MLTLLSGIIIIIFGMIVDYRIIVSMLYESRIVSIVIHILLLLLFFFVAIFPGAGIVYMGIEELREKKEKRQ